MKQLLGGRRYLKNFQKENQLGEIFMMIILERVEKKVYKIKLGIMHNDNTFL